MALIARQNKILKIISKIRKVTVRELLNRFQVTEATIRRDLTSLEEKGYISRTHGGAVLAEDIKKIRPIINRDNYNYNEKLAIARLAKSLIEDGDTIFIDSGNTCALLAREIKDMNLRIICHSIGVLVELVECPRISLFCLGGNYRHDAGSLIGPMAVENLKKFQFQTCFIGTAGFSDSGIFSSENMIEAQLKSEVLKMSKRRIIITDSSKYNVSAFTVFSDSDNIDILITDDKFPDKEKFISYGIEVLIANT